MAKKNLGEKMKSGQNCLVLACAHTGSEDPPWRAPIFYLYSFFGGWQGSGGWVMGIYE